MDLNWLFSFDQIDLYNFKIGFIVGGVFIIISAVIAKIVAFILFRVAKQAAGISVNTENGILFISSNAISDLIKTLEKDFKTIKIQKVALYQIGSNDFSLNLEITFNAAGEGLVDISSVLQNRILNDLKAVFGITEILKIHIKVKKATLKPSSAPVTPILDA